MLDQVWGKSKCGSQRAVLILACHLRASVMRKVVHLCIRIRSKHLCWYKRRLLQVVLLSTRGRYLMEHKSCLLRNCAIFGKNTEYRLNEWSILFISALFFYLKARNAGNERSLFIYAHYLQSSSTPRSSKTGIWFIWFVYFYSNLCTFLFLINLLSLFGWKFNTL